MSTERIRGLVKWFSNQRGYGFVAPEQGGSDIFVHFSNVQMSGYKTLREGQKVEFEVGIIEKNGKAQSNALEVIVLPEEQPEVGDIELSEEENEENA
jgi:CspA family cold shock protein